MKHKGVVNKRLGNGCSILLVQCHRNVGLGACQRDQHRSLCVKKISLEVHPLDHHLRNEG